MNLVAHQLLSFEYAPWQVGNHLGEIVKGKDYQLYNKEIAKGILLHRHIDSYTDSHEKVKHSSSLLHKNYGKYSPIIVDIFYDYLLIKNWDRFSKVDFYTFRMQCYQTLSSHLDVYPSKLQNLTKAMIKYDWFAKYGTLEGLEITLKNLSKRTTFHNNMHMAVKELYMKEEEFNKDFIAFFPDLETSCKDFLGLKSI